MVQRDSLRAWYTFRTAVQPWQIFDRTSQSEAGKADNGFYSRTWHPQEHKYCRWTVIGTFAVRPPGGDERDESTTKQPSRGGQPFVGPSNLSPGSLYSLQVSVATGEVFYYYYYLLLFCPLRAPGPEPISGLIIPNPAPVLKPPLLAAPLPGRRGGGELCVIGAKSRVSTSSWISQSSSPLGPYFRGGVTVINHAATSNYYQELRIPRGCPCVRHRAWRTSGRLLCPWQIQGYLVLACPCSVCEQKKIKGLEPHKVGRCSWQMESQSGTPRKAWQDTWEIVPALRHTATKAKHA